ncbi:hypothetical protein OG288_29245 [Streptomyces tauricus]|uniref:Uncharacterized protein n=1 Tax=Streptomyces tauricus TaxID=68274 RepID=A0ABZ1JL71_9ACTN|nr:hypothetical protein [Streptomyces tauricus]
MTTQDGLRLLPWAGPDGKPCYLSTEDQDSYVSRLADQIEATQLGMASALLEQALQVLDDGASDPEWLSLLVAQLAGSLRDVLRVANSRGSCLAMPDLLEGEPQSDRRG